MPPMAPIPPISRRALILALLLIALAALILWTLRRPKGEKEERRVLTPAAFADLPGWKEDDLSAALSAFLRSCRRLQSPACEGLKRRPGLRADLLRVPIPALRGQRRAAIPEGLFTGYYEPLLHGSRKRSERYRVPLYVRPPDLVTVDLGDFREELKGQRIAGRVEEGALVPYPDREAIEQGALAGRDLELVWVDDPVDAFFLQIQGSGRVRLDDGSEMRVGYAAQNGHPYFAIGKDLVERGAHAEGGGLHAVDPPLAGGAPGPGGRRDGAQRLLRLLPGAEGRGPARRPGRRPHARPLAGRGPQALAARHPGLARRQAPSPREGEPDRPLRRLMIAQDTGGAIRGVGPRRRLLGARRGGRGDRRPDEAPREDVGAAAAPLELWAGAMPAADEASSGSFQATRRTSH